MSSIEQQTTRQESFSHQISSEFISPIRFSAEMPITRKEKQRHVTNTDTLLQAKEIYDSWLPEEHNNVSFLQALYLYKNNCKTSRIVDDKTLSEIKEEIPKLLQEQNIKLEVLIRLRFVIGYEPNILKMFGDNPRLKISILEDIFYKDCPGMDSKNHKEREKLVQETINNGVANCQNRGRKEGTRFIKKPKNKFETIDSPIKIIKPVINQDISKTTPKPKETPIIETPLLINNPIFSEQFEAIQHLKHEYLKDKRLSNINIQKAIRLTHPLLKDTEIEPSSFSSGTRSILERWFQNNLPKYGINNISELDYKSLLPFLNANPNIVTFFDNQASETKLGESTFKMITISFPRENFYKIQRLISEHLVQIPLELRLNDENTKIFLERCKEKLTLQTDEKTTKQQIKSIYRELI